MPVDSNMPEVNGFDFLCYVRANLVYKECQ